MSIITLIIVIMKNALIVVYMLYAVSSSIKTSNLTIILTRKTFHVVYI